MEFNANRREIMLRNFTACAISSALLFVAFSSSQQQQAKPAIIEDEDKKPTVYRKGKLPKEMPAKLGDMDLKKLFEGNNEAQVFLFDWCKAGGKADDFEAIRLTAPNADLAIAFLRSLRKYDSLISR